MFHRNSNGKSQKRKLDYPRNETVSKKDHMTKTQLFKSLHVKRTRQESEWQRATEGFSGLTTCEKTKSTKKARHPQKYRIPMPCDSESEADLEVENAINWNSSDDDVSMVSDVKGNAETIAERHQKAPAEESRSNKKNCDTKQKLLEQNEEDFPVIEDIDSRSSFTLSGSNNTKSNEIETDLEEIEDIQVSSSIEASLTLDSPDQRSRVKASDWMKSLDLETPTKQSPSNLIPMGDDSAKKKKKYSRNGLADQLYKLQVRERSAVRMWNHQTPLDEKPSSKSVMVKVIEYELLHSIQLARCREINEDTDTTQAEIYVLFSAEMTEELNISTGTVVRIFPPWQKLKLHSLKRTVLLCTNYVRVQENHSSIDNVTQHKVKITTSTIEWKCPCVTGLIKDNKKCPAYQFPCIPGVLLSQDIQTGSNRSSDLSQTQHEQSLYMVQSTQSLGTTSSVSDSILQSIDKSSLQTGLCFRSLVHRIICRIDLQAHVKRYCLLVEDGHGIMSEIQMPDYCERSYEEVIEHGEGSSYIFSGLKVLARITRDRDPALFSMIDCIWSGGNILAVSEESETASCSNISQTLPPGFCYSMTEQNTSDFSITEVMAPVTNFKKMHLSSLTDLKQDPSTLKRWSFKVKVLATLLNSDLPSGIKMDFRCLLYVTDNSLEDYVTVRVKQTCYFKHPTDVDILIRDVFYVNGDLICDCYSQIMIVNTKLINKFDLDIPDGNVEKTCLPAKLTENSGLYDLCTVEGIISEIDESSAYSLEVCDKCGKDRLAEKPNTKELVCLGCKRVVNHPVIKMKMEVYVKLSHIESTRVRVDLSEETIQSLLPDDDCNDEGYDIGTVQNSTVGPICCVVVRKNNMDFFLKEIKFS